ncbi:MAG: hypothetical protein [Bacteriophage sp.]|nr:MAG: hypothetical protein [Bacteriophage sp.]
MFDCYVEMFTCFNLDDPQSYLVYNQGRQDVYIDVSWTQMTVNLQRLVDKGGVLYIGQDTAMDRALCHHLRVNNVPFKFLLTGHTQTGKGQVVQL